MSTVTLKKISELTGLSIRSVKRAIKGEEGISEARREEVMKAVRELGYVPNIAARNLRLRQSNFVGIFYSASNMSQVLHRKMTELQQLLESKDIFTIFGLLKDDEVGLRSDLEKWAGLAETVIFLSWNTAWDPEKVLSFMPQQFIFVDAPEIKGFHSIELDRSSGISDGVRHLLKDGRSRIARCGDVRWRQDGFTQAFGKEFANIQCFHLPILPASFENGYAVGAELLEKKVDAVFFDTDKMACGFLKYCWKYNIRIPDEIAVIGFDDEAWDIYSCPSLSTVAHPISEVNEAIAELIFAPRKKPEKKIFKTRFIKRESV